MYEEYRTGAITMTDRTNYIDRQTAYDVLTEFYHHTTDVQHNALREALNKVPSAQPERKVGKWLFTDAAPHRVYCSVCYKTFIPNKEWIAWKEDMIPRNYCPNCGARMDGD